MNGKARMPTASKSNQKACIYMCLYCPTRSRLASCFMLVFVFAFFTSRGLQADDREWHVCNQPSKEEYSKEGKNTKKATTRRK